MKRKHAVAAGALLIAALVLVPACSKTSVCAAPAGGRCPGPLPITSASVNSAGTAVFVDTFCGGRLVSRETRSAVTLTYLASAVGPGGMSCACIRLEADLASPIGRRTLVDGTTGKAVIVDDSHPLCGAPGVGAG